MKQYSYRILIAPEEEGGFSVSVPSLPGCFTQGETVNEAIAMAEQVVRLYLHSLQDVNEPIPDDSKSLQYILTINS